jgi:copper chaperone CopZ
MKNLFSAALVAFALVFTSCESAQENKNIDPANIAVAHIEIEGMMCGDGCGGKIKQELKELDCVADANIEFNAENPVDIAIVQFDKGQCGEQAFIDKIQAIGDGNYHVKTVTIQ